jgi:hypothetical protein
MGIRSFYVYSPILAKANVFSKNNGIFGGKKQLICSILTQNILFK